MCQASGYCSFDDAECGSGQRYGAHAPAHIAGTCVDPGNADTQGDTFTTGPDPSTSLTTSATTTATGTTTSAGPASDPSSPMTADTSLTSDPTGDPSGNPSGDPTGDPTGGSTVTVDDESSDETAPPILFCRTEEFDDEILDDWVLVQGGPTEAFIDEDLLIVDLSPMPSSAGLDPVVFGVPDGSLEVEVFEVPNQVLGTQVYLGIGTGDESYLMLLEDGIVILRHDMGNEGYENLTEVQWGSDVLWWHVDVAGGELSFFVSDDGVGWEPLDTVAPAFDLGVAQWFLRAGTWVKPPGPAGYALFERMTLCTLE